MNKTETLAEIEGFDSFEELVEEFAFDSVVPGICMNPGCDYTTNVEPDQEHGWCEFCDTQTVTSCLCLAGVV